MDLSAIVTQFASQAQVIRSLTEGISTEQAAWRPDEHSWSILEVINHLCDEERDDFRLRFGWILCRETGAWPPIDPAGWVVSRKYNQRDLTHSVAEFLREREVSLQWLYGLADPDWSIVYQASFGPISAGEMISSWLAHDLLHTRQLVELRWYYTTRQVVPYNVRYAGEW